MNFIKSKLFLFLFSTLSISASSSNNKTKKIKLDNVIIEDYYKINRHLMYARNFEEYKKKVSIIISENNKDI